jgi:DNA-binding LacI/PurR family transcriptional regulator/DNA-binding FadR family transcriptional regulator
MSKSDFLANSIAERVAGGSWPPGGRMPTVRELAAQWNTSAVTMVKVLRMLRERGVLQRAEGFAGCFVKGQVPRTEPHPGSDVPRGRYHEVARTMREEILSGTYRPGEPLPQRKYLLRRFRCSRTTLNAALDLLVRQRLLERDAGRCLVRQTRPARRSASSVYVCGYPEMLEHHFDDVYTAVQAVERAVQKLGWGPLQFFLTGSNVQHVRMLPQLPHRAPPDHRVAGYILVRYLYRGGWKRFLLQKKNIPLVVIDFDQMADFETSEDPIANDHNFAARHGRCTILVPDNRIAGREVGNHLASLGHRAIAFFTHVGVDDPEQSREAWPRLRWEGLGEVFAPGGGDDGRGMKLFDGSGALGRSSFKQRWQRRPRTNGAASNLPESLREESATAVGNARYYAAVGRAMAPLFEKALAERSVSAWVCVNDPLAAIALKFLQDRGIAVPGRIALAAFDNARPSYRSDITSYDFGYERIGNLAVSRLAHPRLLGASRSPVMHVEGQLVARRSTAERRREEPARHERTDSARNS